MSSASHLQTELQIRFGGLQINLRHDGTAFLPDSNTLLVADPHLGKEHSFRARQIPVPDGPTAGTLKLLTNSLQEVNPDHLVILGDLIHDSNSLNPQLSHIVTNWRKQHASLKMTLVRGNHDRYVERFPSSWALEEVAKLNIPASGGQSVLLVHQSPEPSQTDVHVIEGHWHPVAKIGKGADQTKARCFVQTDSKVTLPAFGPFKGGMVVSSNSAMLYPLIEGYIFLAR